MDIQKRKKKRKKEKKNILYLLFLSVLVEWQCISKIDARPSIPYTLGLGQTTTTAAAAAKKDRNKT
jgi:homoserine kinase